MCPNIRCDIRVKSSLSTKQALDSSFGTTFNSLSPLHVSLHALLATLSNTAMLIRPVPRERIRGSILAVKVAFPCVRSRYDGTQAEHTHCAQSPAPMCTLVAHHLAVLLFSGLTTTTRGRARRDTEKAWTWRKNPHAKPCMPWLRPHANRKSRTLQRGDWRREEKAAREATDGREPSKLVSPTVKRSHPRGAGSTSPSTRQ